MWFFRLDAMKCWVVLSGLLGGFDSHLVDLSNVNGQIGAPLQGLIFLRRSAVMDDLVIVLANKD